MMISTLRCHAAYWGKKALKVIVILFALAGLYQAFTSWQWHSAKKTSLKKEAAEGVRIYDKDLLYLQPDGNPIFWVKPGNTKTLFFIEGFRGGIGVGLYKEWLKELFEKEGVNIVGPIIGLQGWPFEGRNRDWMYQEDMRQALQIYDAYTANLPAGHRVVIASQSFGTLPNITIAAKSKRPPDAYVLMSPLNTSFEYRSGGAMIRWLAKQRGWLKYIIPFTGRNVNPNRAGYWDIVNDQMNRDVWEKTARHIICWEENVSKGVQVDTVLPYMENELVPQVKGKDMIIIYGDDDLYFGRAGFQNLAKLLRSAGNTVETMELEKTGHMLLLDNGGEKAKKAILDIIKGRYVIRNN